ncbi:MAG: methyltransferase [Candidatus Diapherotrites archaeon]|nr:methyltransferase [Candidatus Diapherotrites archaeon]
MKRVFFKGFELVVYDSVYEPREDSFLLAENVKVKPGIKALDMGCGCGIQAINLALQRADVLAADINERAVANTIENARRCGLSDKISTVQSDLFNAVENRKFDCIVFNPPYLPASRLKDASVEGGKYGYELLHKFLDKIPLHLKENGFCYFVQSSLDGELRTKRKLKKLGLGFEIVARQKLFFEELMVFKAFFSKL